MNTTVAALTHNYDRFIEVAPDAQAAAARLERLCDLPGVERHIARLNADLQKDLIAVISLSNFLFHFLVRHPDAIGLIGNPPRQHAEELIQLRDIEALRLYKYRELLKIVWMDIACVCEYREILTALSRLAEDVLQQALRLSLPEDSYKTFTRSTATIALGKLGANELNFSSDIDLMFVSVNPDLSLNEYQALQKIQFDSIRTLNRALEEKTAEGFLYRVDLKLRPWGNSGPLCMAIDDTENYYAVSSEPWERFAWLRARLIAGSETLWGDLQDRMHPFVFKRSLSTDDLAKFVAIKNDMAKARRRAGNWNVKVGEGGIRDIEFFIQMLQLANAAGNKNLQTTSTLEALAGLRNAGLITNVEEQEILATYLFLRQLENRLQMVDERQTHDLPDSRDKRLLLARSMRMHGDSNEEILNAFEENLIAHRSIAKKYFERILPGEQIV